MSATIQPAVAQTLDEKYCPSLQIPAVALCVEGWEKTFRATLQKTGSVYSAKRCAVSVYRMAMPPLTGHQSIRDFIACAAYGMLLGAIKPEPNSSTPPRSPSQPSPKKAKSRRRPPPARPATPPLPPLLLQTQQTKRIKPKNPRKNP